MVKYAPYLAVALFGSFLVAACTSPAPSSGLTETTGNDRTWQTVATTENSAEVPADWWTTFEDAELTAAVEASLVDNFDLQAAAMRVEAVSAQLRMVAGDRLPKLNAGLDLSRSRSNVIGLPFPGAPDVLPITNNRHNLGLNLSWELDLWGRLAAQEKTAVASLEASQADWQAARLSLAGQAAKVYLQLVEANQQLLLTQELLAILDSQLEHLRLRFQQGTAADAMLQAQAAVESAQKNVLAATQRRNALERQQALLQGGYPQISNPAEWRDLPALPQAVPSGLPATLVQRRPDLAASAAQLRAARFQSQAADAALYPALSLTAAGGTSSNELADLLNGDFKVWSLGASLTAPLFHGGSLHAQADAAEASANASGLAFVQQVLRAFAEVEIALDSEQLLAQQLHSQQSAHSILQERANRATTRFAGGVGMAESVYQTRSALVQSQSNLHATQLLLLLNRIDLYLALGGGFHTAN